MRPQILLHGGNAKNPGERGSATSIKSGSGAFLPHSMRLCVNWLPGSVFASTPLFLGRAPKRGLPSRRQIYYNPHCVGASDEALLKPIPHTNSHTLTLSFGILNERVTVANGREGEGLSEASRRQFSQPGSNNQNCREGVLIWDDPNQITYSRNPRPRIHLP